ncbi:hypothetical protein SELMODRAFT_234257 [Selaginella moellendorffii]|uniref:Protein kinase domain-containing protein n=1 Tax=Selaginella moellendorffii TaxID=88036 RepID=D8SJC0_SELML|nr:hypothetical protein SELMODRAFT_234257 [Selaginella moellendorffii]
MLEQDLTRENTEDFFNEISLLRQVAFFHFPISSRLRHPNGNHLVHGSMHESSSPVNGYRIHAYGLTLSPHPYERTRKEAKLAKKTENATRYLQRRRDLFRGMMCVQRMNIIHRDLKSANCLVDKHWCVKICDFGLSRLTTGTPIQETTAAGTPEWMAPELLRNEPVSYKCDIFSLGVIMWELCTLKKPWDGVQPLQASRARSLCETIPSGNSSRPPWKAHRW